MKLALCIPTLRSYDTLKTAVESAFSGSVKPNALCIIDNGGKLDFTPYQKYDVPTFFVQPGHNLGVAASWNAFYDLVPKDYELIIANDDVEFYEDTLYHFWSALVTALNFTFFYPGGVNKEGNIMNAFSLFCARRIMYNMVGPFDEHFYPAYFEDNDWAYRAKLQGWMLNAMPCSYGHVGSNTIRLALPGEADQHHHSFRVNRALYRAKWGGLPHHETFTTEYNGAKFEDVVKTLRPE